MYAVKGSGLNDIKSYMLDILIRNLRVYVRTSGPGLLEIKWSVHIDGFEFENGPVEINDRSIAYAFRIKRFGHGLFLCPLPFRAPPIGAVTNRWAACASRQSFNRRAIGYLVTG